MCGWIDRQTDRLISIGHLLRDLVKRYPCKMFTDVFMQIINTMQCIEQRLHLEDMLVSSAHN